jgi:hypothetical protein
LQVNVLAPGLEHAHLLEDTHQWGQEESRRRGSLLPQLRGGVYRDFRGIVTLRARTMALKLFLTQAVVLHHTDGSLQMMSLGDPSLVLNYCREYWDGSTRSITPLSSADRAEVLQVYERWRLEDFEVVAFCYSPLPTASLNPLLSAREDTLLQSAATPTTSLTRRGSASISGGQAGRASFSLTGKAPQFMLGAPPFASSKYNTLFFVDPITVQDLQRVAAGITSKNRHAAQKRLGHKAEPPADVKVDQKSAKEQTGGAMMRSRTAPQPSPPEREEAKAAAICAALDVDSADYEDDSEGARDGGMKRAVTLDPRCLRKTSGSAKAGDDAPATALQHPGAAGPAEEGHRQEVPVLQRFASSGEVVGRATSRSEATYMAQHTEGGRPRGVSGGPLVKSVSMDHLTQYARDSSALAGDLATARRDSVFDSHGTELSSPSVGGLPSPLRVSTSVKDFRDARHLSAPHASRSLVDGQPSPHLSFQDDDETATVTSELSPSISEAPSETPRFHGLSMGIAGTYLDATGSDDGRSRTPPLKPIKRSTSQSGISFQLPTTSVDDSAVGLSDSRVFAAPTISSTPPPLPRARAGEVKAASTRLRAESQQRKLPPSLRKHASEYVPQHPFFVPTARFADGRGLTARQRLHQEQQRAHQLARQQRRSSTRQLWTLMRQQVSLSPCGYLYARCTHLL